MPGSHYPCSTNQYSQPLQLHVLQFPSYLGGHSKICQYLFELGDTKLRIRIHLRVYEYGIEANSHFLKPASYTLPVQPSTQLTFITARTHCWPIFNLLSTTTLKTFSLKSLSSCHFFNLFLTRTWLQVLLNFVIPVFSSDKNLEFPLTLVGPFKQHCSIQVSLVCKLAKELHPIVWVAKDIKQSWFQDQPLSNAWQHS